jgi:hypothetical protein
MIRRTSRRCPCCGQKPVNSDAPAWNGTLGTLTRFGKIVVMPNSEDAALFDCLWRYRTRGYFISSPFVASEMYRDNPDDSPLTIGRGVYVRSDNLPL